MTHRVGLGGVRGIVGMGGILGVVGVVGIVAFVGIREVVGIGGKMSSTFDFLTFSEIVYDIT